VEKKMIREMNGLLEEWTSDYDQISIDGEALGDQYDFEDFIGKKVFVRYFISAAPIVDLDAAIEGQLRTFFGALEAEAYTVFGSEWTGEYGFNQEFVVGGHDLIEELRTHVGKYILLEVRTEE
jgi:hypothetical protein